MLIIPFNYLGSSYEVYDPPIRRTVEITVQDDLSNALTDAEVFIERDGAKVGPILTNSSGVARANLEEGSWNITSNKAGYRTAATLADVDVSTTTFTATNDVESMSGPVEAAAMSGSLQLFEDSGEISPSVPIEIEFLEMPSELTGESFPIPVQTISSNAVGFISPLLVKGAKFQLRRRISNSTTIALLLSGSAGVYASSVDTTTLSIIGDLDVRLDMVATDWTPSAVQTVVSKWNTTGNQRSWFLDLKTDGKLELQVSTNGSATTHTFTSSAATGIADNSRKWIRFTLDITNGSNSVCTFYTSVDGVTWTMLGSSQTSTTISSIFDSTASLILGAKNASSDHLAGRIYYLEVRNGISGAVVTNPDFTILASGTTSFNDSKNVTWTKNGGASIASDGVTVAKWSSWKEFVVPVSAPPIWQLPSQLSSLASMEAYQYSSEV